jgi:branched-chain amino acid transport system ATP-binding protein
MTTDGKAADPIVRAERLTKRFGGLAAVSRLAFAAEPGQIVGIIGANGAGKTTLFHLITGFQRPTAGEIRFEGRPIVGLRPHAICRLGIARTFQIVQPFPHLSVLANAMVGGFNRVREPERAREAAWRALAFVGLEARAEQEARTLTLAERKRLEVARALATGPKLLLLDEVMAGLATSEVALMMDLCRRVRAEGVGVLVIEHLLRAVMALSDRLIVLDHGEKIAEGPPAAVSVDARVIAAYLGTRHE